jgi:hypothetical protein
LNASVLVVEGQLITGTVIDEKTQAPLPYVNIGIVNKNFGVISRDNGSFEIDLTHAPRHEELIFSMLGYEKQKFTIASLTSGSLTVRLKPRTYQLKEVIVKSTKIKKAEKLGRHKPTKTTTGHSNTGSYGFGGEWGLKIFCDGKRYRVADIQFHTRFNTLDSILYRIHIYSVVNDLPGESIVDKELFVKSRKNQKWIVRDLTKEGIVIDQDVIITFEVVQLWYNPSKDNQLFFTHGEGYERGGTYARQSSLDIWTRNQRPPIAMFLTVDPE